MKVQKAMKKIVAIGAGATMLGATIFGAMAADLSDYPSPFVKDGKFNTKIVIGAKAQTPDVIGAIDIANSLQFASRVAKDLPGSSGAVTIDNGVSMAASGRDIYMGDDINVTKQVVTSSDMPTLLKSGTVTNEDGTYTYNQQIVLPGGSVAFGDVSTDDSNDPFVYVNWASNDGYKMKVIFPQATNLTLADNEQITLFGKTYTVSGTSGEVTSTKVTLYSAALDQVFTAGESATVDMSGTPVDISVTGANSDKGTAVLTINGETKSVSKANTYTIGGQKVYVNDVFVTTVPTPSAAVRLFIGSEKIVLENGNSVQVGSTSTSDISGTTVTITAGSGKISQIEIDVQPRNVEVDSNTRDYTKVGEEFVDPVFGTFKLLFASLTPELMDASRDVIKLDTADPYLKLTFTNKDGNTYNGLRIAEGNTSGDGTGVSVVANNDPLLLLGGATISGASGNKNAFIVDADGNSYIMRLDKVYNSSTESYIKLYDYATGQTTDKITVTSGAATYTLAGKTFTFTVPLLGAETATVSPANVNYVYTKSGAKIAINGINSTGGIDLTNLGDTNITVNLTEETSYNDWSGTPSWADDAGWVITYNNANSDNDMRISTVAVNATSSVQTSDSNKYELVSNYGTFIKTDTDSYDAEIYYPNTQMVANIFLAPVDSTASTSGASSGGTYYDTNRVQVGAAVLDTTVLSGYQDSNLIVVGGPCVNTVAAKLRNNPENCAEGFKDGEAIIKLYDTGKGKVALLVAGMSADDTVVASKILAQANALGSKVLSGSEVKTQTVTESVVTVQSA
ncbi:hypothetical protein COY28_06345 [Candidatus Woesearchaeota archaeon CG_4_10_14_0_2_um_filter_57_5]|nr:MAG: hypothetical protein COY28_06345 [Candidatus Woesearchaeota archaeon CG_4_10_14_0_2_um_filter_57_5]